MNTYHIHYFGLLADRRGAAEETLASSAATPSELYRSLAGKHPLGIPPEHLRVAVDDEMTGWDHPLRDGDRVAFLPPMSGG